MKFLRSSLTYLAVFAYAGYNVTTQHVQCDPESVRRALFENTYMPVRRYEACTSCLTTCCAQA